MTPEERTAALEAKRNRPVMTNENRDEYVSQARGLSEPKAETPIGEVKPEEPKTDPKAETKPEEPKGDESPAVKPSFQDRISEVVHQRNEARAQIEAEKKRAAELEKQLAEFRAKVEPPKPENTKPDKSAFTDPFEYAEKLSEWSAQEALRKRDAEEASRRAEEAQRALATAWETRQAAFKAATPEYEAVVQASDIVVSDEVRDAILESDVGPQLLYHLAMNPEVGKKLQTMSRTGALREIGRMEATLAQPVTKPETKTETKPIATSKAPAPITPIGGGTATPTSGPVDEDGNVVGDYQAYKAARRAGKIK